MPRTVPIVLKSGQRFTAEVDDNVTQEQLVAQLANHGASLDQWAMAKQAMVSKMPTGTKWAGEAMIPGSLEQFMGDVVMAAVGIKGASLAAKGGYGLAARAGLRLAGPAAGAATTAAAGEVTGDVSGARKAALGMFLAGGAGEGVFAAGRFVGKNIGPWAANKISENASERLGQAVQRWFPNKGTEQEMIYLFREGGADKVIGQRLGAIEKDIFDKVGPSSQLYLPSLPEVNKLVSAKVTLTDKKIPVGNFGEAWDALKELRALRRSALSATEPMKHQQVLRVTAALEDDMRQAFRTAAPDALLSFEAEKKIGREMYAVAETLKGAKIFQAAPRPEGGRMDLNPLLEEFMAPGIGKREPLMQELIEAGAGDLIHGVLPPGAKAGAADVIHAGRGIYARTRIGEGTATGGLLPFPESRRFAVPPAGSDILRPLGTAAAGQAGGEGLRQVQVPGFENLSP